MAKHIKRTRSLYS